MWSRGYWGLTDYLRTAFGNCVPYEITDENKREVRFESSRRLTKREHKRMVERVMGYAASRRSDAELELHTAPPGGRKTTGVIFYK